MSTPGLTRAAQLLERYRSLGDPPDWAHKGLPAPIPFVGRDYGSPEKPKVLIYASAENLTWLSKTKPDWWAGDALRNRHRVGWDEGLRAPRTSAKRGIYIGPFDDGGLWTAAGLLWDWEGGPPLFSPEELVESIAVGNLSKFTIDSEKTNVDPGAAELPDSVPYLREDFATLEPDVILVAKPIGFDLALILGQWAERVGAMTVPMFQFQPRAFGACAKALEREAGAASAEHSIREVLEQLRAARGHHHPRASAHVDGPALAWFALLAFRYQRHLDFVRATPI